MFHPLSAGCLIENLVLQVLGFSQLGADCEQYNVQYRSNQDRRQDMGVAYARHGASFFPMEWNCLVHRSL